MVERVHIGVVHPRRLYREGIAGALSRDPNIEIVAVAGDCEELFSQLAPVELDVAVVDLALPGKAGLAFAQEINEAFPRAGIIMTGLGDLERDALTACEAGATGFVHQDASLQELHEQVLAVARGEMACSPRLAALLSSRLRQRVRHIQRLHTTGIARLTRRELEVVTLIDRRMSNKEIAVELRIGVQTVKNHVHNILEKLELRGRFALARYARENGILPSALEKPKGD